MAATSGHFPPHGMPAAHPEIVLNEHNSFASAGNSSGSGASSAILSYPHQPRQVLTKDGQPAKRRGPKPDSKPALTKRQQRNRQAQRTHRERRENYLRGMELDNERLQESWARTQREKERVEAENQRMRALLAQHGIRFETVSLYGAPSEASGAAPSSSGSISGSYATGSDRDGMSPDSSMTPASSSYSNSSPQPHYQQPRSLVQTPSTRLDYDSIAVEFVLKYGSPNSFPSQPSKRPAPYPSPPPQG